MLEFVESSVFARYVYDYLTDDEYASLARSARAILIKGGGALESVMDRVRRWRPFEQPDERAAR